jgi:hypothetical protein
MVLLLAAESELEDRKQLAVGMRIVASNIDDYRITHLTANNEEQYVLPDFTRIESYLAVSREEVEAVLGQYSIGIYLI